MQNQISTWLAIIVLVIATIMVLALTASIALIFTVGRPTNNSKNHNNNNTSNNSSNGNQSTIMFLAEPCECGCPAISPKITSRIINGEAAILNSWPWQLLLIQFSYEGVPRVYCGASLITPKHVLTAAHCVFGLSPRYIGVIPRLHVFNTSSWSRDVAYMAERIYVHESFDDRSGVDDVAVIRLRTPIPLDDDVSLICLAPANMSGQKLVQGEELIATGWGVVERINRSVPNVLKQVRLQFVPQTDPLCAPLVGAGDHTRPGQMCAGFPPKAVCFGDSGGPLVRSIVHPNGKTYWQQVGIMSWTVDCGSQTNFPDVYSRVSYYNPWIIDKIRASP
jgi:secreted trypsin-like serine protease